MSCLFEYILFISFDIITEVKMFYKELFLTLFLSFIFGKIEAYDCLGYPWYDATILGPHSMGCIRFYGTQRMTWIEAEDFCRSENAHLIEIYDDV